MESPDVRNGTRITTMNPALRVGVNRAESSNIQTPRSRKVPNFNIQQTALMGGRERLCWSLGFEVYLELGSWFLELIRRSCVSIASPFNNTGI
jgi:hypothetical protein